MRGTAVSAVVMAAALVLPCAAGAQEPNQVTGLSAAQDVGFTTLRWAPVAGATDYQIERTPVDASDQPTGAATIVGVWQPQRTITPAQPAFAESGYALGGRYSWRVRARFGTADPQPYSAPVTATTLPVPGTGPVGGLRTAWEDRTTNVYTSDVEEAAYTAALDAASDRVRVVELARTLENRPMNMLVIGYPKPPDTAAEISAKPTYALNCNVHGNEASGRESCFTMARQLAATEDPALLELLSRIVVLIVPSTNPDGRAHNTRGNTTGQDLNRDHALIEQNETKGLAKLIRDYTPDVMVDNHEGDSEDLPILGARHLNVEQSLFDEGKLMVNEWMYGAAAQSGWWMGPYSTGGDSHEGILRNTGALKNGVSMLGEARAGGGATRPAEGSTNSRANESRKVYAHLWENWEGLRYLAARLPQIQAAIANSVSLYTGGAFTRTVLRGAYPWPSVPSVGEGSNAPDVDAPTAARILDPAPCGYFIPQAEYTAARGTFGSVEERLAIHGIKVEPQAGGVLVPLRQPYGGLVAPLLDANAVLPMIPTAQRRYSCPKVDFTVSGTVPATLSLGLDGPASFGAFTAGVDRDYLTSATATVVSTAGDATLTASDPSDDHAGHLVNGAFFLAQPLQVSGSALPATVKTYDAPVANDTVTIDFKQSIGAADALRTGTYSKTLTFTLSTTTP